MATFVIGTPIDTTDASIEVTVDPARPLAPGRHRFQLVVVDDSGNQSAPAAIDVIVRDTARPTAVIDAPSQVEAGRSFTLQGNRSSDVPPGRIVQFVWTMLS